MVVFLRSTDCNPDPRVRKYIDALNSEGLHSHIICWDRSALTADDAHHTYFRHRAEYGSGMRNYKSLLGFNLFLFQNLYRRRKSYQIIHACDFDTILPALFFKVFFGKKVIYDIFDWFVDSRNISSNVLKKCILLFERMALRQSDIVIICDERRRQQLNQVPKVLWILPNIPQIKIEEKCRNEQNKSPEKLYLAYVGILPIDRGLDKILKCVSQHPDLVLDIAGFGILAESARSYGERYDNIRFHGAVPYADGISIMSQADLIIATYEKSSKNNVYAAPNKYYEGLFLGKAILTTEGTILADSTLSYRTGFVIGETFDDYEAFFSDVRSLKEECTQYGLNAKKLWNDTYRDYVGLFMHTKYLRFIRSSLQTMP